MNAYTDDAESRQGLGNELNADGLPTHFEGQKIRLDRLTAEQKGALKQIFSLPTFNAISLGQFLRGNNLLEDSVEAKRMEIDGGQQKEPSASQHSPLEKFQCVKVFTRDEVIQHGVIIALEGSGRKAFVELFNDKSFVSVKFPDDNHFKELTKEANAKGANKLNWLDLSSYECNPTDFG